MIPEIIFKKYSEWIKKYPESSLLPIKISNNIFYNEQLKFFKKLAKDFSNNKEDEKNLLAELIEYYKI